MPDDIPGIIHVNRRMASIAADIVPTSLFRRSFHRGVTYLTSSKWRWPLADIGYGITSRQIVECRAPRFSIALLISTRRRSSRHTSASQSRRQKPMRKRAPISPRKTLIASRDARRAPRRRLRSFTSDDIMSATTGIINTSLNRNIVRRRPIWRRFFITISSLGHVLAADKDIAKRFQCLDTPTAVFSRRTK